jgi:hypothetical protein
MIMRKYTDINKKTNCFSGPDSVAFSLNNIYPILTSLPILLLLIVISLYRLAGLSSELNIVDRLNFNDTLVVFLPVATCSLYIMVLFMLYFGIHKPLNVAIKQFNKSTRDVNATRALVRTCLSVDKLALLLLLLSVITGWLSIILESSYYGMLGYLEPLIATLSSTIFIAGLIFRHKMITTDVIAYAGNETHE